MNKKRGSIMIKKYLYQALLLALVLAMSGGCARAAELPAPADPMGKYQFRGAWIATVANIDWPSKPGLTPGQQREEFIRLLDVATDLKLNAVIVQIRPAADAFYRSQINPWSEYLTGVQGADPGYDPLAFMIQQAHARNLELHAWMNPFRASNYTTDKGWSQLSVIKQHPQWIVDYDNKKLINPGVPEAREYVIRSVLEVVRNYDVDAIHFDDYFYPYPAQGKDFPDDTAYNAYNSGQFPNKADWRRDNINQFMQGVYQAIKQEKPYVRLGVSPFAIWRSKAADPAGVSVKTDMSTYDKLYADTRLWVRNEWVDYIAPQIYWEFSNNAAPYEEILNFWVEEMENNRNVQLYIGHATYRVGTEGAWLDPMEIPNQIKMNQQHDVVKGSIFYNMSSLVRDPLGFEDEIKSGVYRYYALIPPALTKPGQEPAPDSVTIKEIKPVKSANEITIFTGGGDVDHFVIYRCRGAAAPNTDDPAQIAAIVKKNQPFQQVYTDRLDTAYTGMIYTYAVTAVNRLNQESAASQPVSVTN